MTYDNITRGLLNRRAERGYTGEILLEQHSERIFHSVQRNIRRSRSRFDDPYRLRDCDVFQEKQCFKTGQVPCGACGFVLPDIVALR